MKRIVFELMISAGIMIVILSGCKKEIVRSFLQNKIPVAFAGGDQIILLPDDSAALNGRGIDIDGSIISYEWKIISGPGQYTLINSMAAVTKAKNLVEGEYVFELKVTDSDGFSATDEVMIAVLVSSNDPGIGYWDY